MLLKRKRGKLFYKLLVFFLTASLVPLAMIGFFMFGVSRNALRDITLRYQEVTAKTLAVTVDSQMIAYHDVLKALSVREEFQGTSKDAIENLLVSVSKSNREFIEITYINPEGKEMVSVKNGAITTTQRSWSRQQAFSSTMQDGDYLGGFDKFNNEEPVVTYGVKILDPANHMGIGQGVIIGKLQLASLGRKIYSIVGNEDQSFVALISPRGFVISHSLMRMQGYDNYELPTEIIDIVLRNIKTSDSGMVDFKESQSMLGAYAQLPKIGWIVYIQKPLAVVDKMLDNMLSKSMMGLVFVIIFVFIVGYLTSYLIVSPMETLKEAAKKLGTGTFEDLPALQMPNDEIGELASTFYLMSESLRTQRIELLNAKNETETLNRQLESRVEARTRELKAAQNELIARERLAAIGQMASVVGHEIRNPLAVINNSIYFIKTKLGLGGELDPKISKHISIIEAEIQQANSIINEILGFARTRDLILSHVKVSAYLDEIITSYPMPNNIIIVKEYLQNDVSVDIDPQEIKQALTNIIGNAKEVMPNGGSLLLRTIQYDPKTVSIEIGDSGVGMSQELIQKVFTPFFTTKARGTGLGLAVVKKVFDRHSGKVEIFSQENKGTTFRLTLPVSETNE